MPVLDHTRVTMRGIFGTVAAPIEEWSFNINFPPRAFASLAQREEVANGIKTAWNTHVSALHMSLVKLTSVRVAQVAPGGLVGRAADGSYNQGDSAGAALAGTGTGGVEMPLQTAVCVSLDTDRPGPRGRGRFFLPQTKFLLNGAHVHQATDATTIATACKTFLNASGLAVAGTTPGLRPQIISKFGFNSPVTAVRVGVVPDTMRSRRGSLPENYQRVAL